MPDELAAPDPSTLRLAFYDGRELAWTCAFTSLHGESLREERCGERTRGSVSILGDDAPRGQSSIRTVHGRLDRFELVRPVPDGEPEATPLPTSVETLALFGDQLVWVSWHHLYARDVGTAHSPLGAPIDLGEVTGTGAEISACATPSALLVGVKTFDKALAPRMSWRVMAAREAGAWQRTPGRSQVDVGATFTCEGHAATWTWFDRKVVTQVRCNRDRCETGTSDPMTLPWDVGGTLYATDLGGRATILGLGTTAAPLTGRSVTSVLMRMAPLAAVTKASDVVLFSDAAHDGAAVSDVSVYVRDGVAVVLLKGDGPLPYRAIRVDSFGNFAPVVAAD
jgi:hypothetical protein